MCWHSHHVLLQPSISMAHKVVRMLQVPIDIAFWGRARLGAWFAGLNLAADLLLMADVVLHFFRAYISHNSVVVTRLAQIRRHYLGANPCIALPACHYTAPHARARLLHAQMLS